jgi:hypothetical protein
MNLNATISAVEHYTAMAQQAAEQVADRHESRAEQKNEIAAARLRLKLAELAPLDLVAGLHSVFVEKHGAALRLAWLDGEEAFGALLMQIVRDQLDAEADLEAEEVLIRIERSAREESPRRTFIIAGV